MRLTVDGTLVLIYKDCSILRAEAVPLSIVIADMILGCAWGSDAHTGGYCPDGRLRWIAFLISGHLC